jgi:hypothetical protein
MKLGVESDFEFFYVLTFICSLDAEAHFLLFSPNRGLRNRPNERPQSSHVWSIVSVATPVG